MPPSAKFIPSEIACYSIVRKFLSKHYSIPLVVASKESIYGNYLAACLDRNPSHRHYIPLEELTDRLPILVAAWRHKSGFGKVLTPVAVLAFNEFVIDSFMNRIMMQLVLAHSFGMSVLRSAQAIIDRYGLSQQEMSLDALVSFYVQHREAYLHLVDEGPHRKGSKKVHLS